MFDYIVVGAGLSGSVFAERIASQLKKRVLLIEQRHHIGGNCYDHYTADGLLVHKYGPHVFHTRAKGIWDYLSQFTEWNFYQHRVLAQVDGNLIPIPFNLNGIEQVFSHSMATKLIDKLVATFGYDSKVPILALQQTTDPDLKLLADYVYERVYLHYTQKHWGLRPEELDKYVTGRMPIRVSRDDRHYQDEYQGIPKYGYTRMFESMLNHQNIKYMLNSDYRELVTVNHRTRQVKFMGQPFAGKLIYTGKIDELFDYCYGELPYRTADFHMEMLQKKNYQKVGTINYPNEYDFMRITEMKHLTGQFHPFTAIIEEYPRQCTRKDVPYYPIPQQANLDILYRYQVLAREYPEIILSGRLADYKYYDMHIAVFKSLNKFNKYVLPQAAIEA